MAIRLSDLIKRDATELGVTNRRVLKNFYDGIVEALKSGELSSQGSSMPSTMNELIRILPRQTPPLKSDPEVTDWSFEEDGKLESFLDRWRAQYGRKGKGGGRKRPSRRIKPIARPLYDAVTQLKEMREGTGVKKAELSDAVDRFLQVYALSQDALKLPDVGVDVPENLPDGMELDESKVQLGNNARGEYVGIVSRNGRRKRGSAQSDRNQEANQ